MPKESSFQYLQLFGIMLFVHFLIFTFFQLDYGICPKTFIITICSYIGSITFGLIGYNYLEYSKPWIWVSREYFEKYFMKEKYREY